MLLWANGGMTWVLRMYLSINKTRVCKRQVMCWKCKVQPYRIFTHQPDFWPSVCHVRQNQLVKRGMCASIRAKLDSCAKCYYIFLVIHLLFGVDAYFTGHHFRKYILWSSIGKKERQGKTSSRGQNLQVDHSSIGRWGGHLPYQDLF